ncbi:MAG: hypothetical protein HWN67_02330 [Candidatus Helarchaeota archaeon]|nr:hypothetical protein [Candidatus Helarchaeota archaeon]
MKLIEQNSIDLPLEKFHLKIPFETIGIDIGQTLTKIAYIKENKLNLILIPTQSDDRTLNDWLKSKKGSFKKYNFTGGRAFNIYKDFSRKFESNLLKEFEINGKGIEILFLLYKKGSFPSSLIVSIGTGTSITLKKENLVKHLGGSALGGGLFMGLVKFLYNITDYYEAINLSKSGNRYNVDLKVSDIYAPEDNRVDQIFREFTAASLAKLEKNLASKEDVINSIICLIAENLGIIANLMAENNNINNLVFSGGFLKGNKILKDILLAICQFNKKKAIFLKNSEFCGAIGALFS